MKYISVILILVSLTLFVLLAAFDLQSAMIAYQLLWAYLLLGAAVVSAVVFPLIYLFRNPSRLKKTAVYAGALAGVFILAVLWSPATASAASKWADISLAVACILLAAAFVAVIIGSILNIKRNS